MPDNSLLKIVDNISYLKLSGINRFLFIDIYSGSVSITLIKSKEKIFKIGRNAALENYEIEFNTTRQISGLSELSTLINTYKEKHELENINAIVNINEFRVKPVTIPNDNDDIELWFVENIGKYLPESQSQENFSYNYKFIKEENDEFHYLLTIVRKEFISNIISVCSKCGIKLMQILTLPVGIHFLPGYKNEISLYLNLTGDMLFFSYSDDESSLSTGEVYEQFVSSAENKINLDILKNSLVSIKESISAENENRDIENIKLILSTTIKNGNVELIIKEVFGQPVVKVGKNNYELTNTVHAVNFVNYSYEKNDGFLNEEFEIETEKIDKDIFNRVVLFFGAVLMVLLLLTYSIEGVVEKIKNNKEDTIVETEAKVKLVESLKEENKTLLANLNSLKKIKEGGVKFNYLFNELTKTLTGKTFLTGLNLRTTNKLNFLIEGIVLDQSELSLNIKNLEENKNFGNVSLISTNVAETGKLDIYNNFYKREVFLFKISIDYENPEK